MATTDYFWIDGEVVEIDYRTQYIPKYCYGYPCVDVSVAKSSTSDISRYGTYEKDNNGHWRHIPKDDMPIQFMMQLVLLGVK